MEDYPAHYLDHNLPFVLLFGLEDEATDIHNEIQDEYPLFQERGSHLSSDLPNVDGAIANELLTSFRTFDTRDAPWNGRPSKGRLGNTGFIFRSVGRVFTLPPRKANPPVSLESSQTSEGPRRSSTLPVLHSPLSPLSPESPMFPDGLMSSLWFSKHQCLVPSAIIAFFEITAEPLSSVVQDNKLKSEINSLKTVLTSSGYKIRLVCVLVGEAEITDAEATERIANVRRGVSLDPRSVFFLSHGRSAVELQAFAGTVLASLQPTCIEYYKELLKRAKRKKQRGIVPPPTTPPTAGTSQILTLHGWNIRYETKIGSFAEFQQEMDLAGRSYASAYDTLLESDVLASIPAWSPRFNESRMLADVLAIRILRCLLWSGQTTTAAQSWSNHRSRIMELVDRKGPGANTYGWQAWEARWCLIMAELIGKVDIPVFRVNRAEALPSSETSDAYAIPEQALGRGEKLPPWHLLHHEGYWLRRSAQHTKSRMILARAIPREDRQLPKDSPGAPATSKSHAYDTYLCPKPHMEYSMAQNPSTGHGRIIIEILEMAAAQFTVRGQLRAVERAREEIAREYMRSQQWDQAMSVLKPLWESLSWRREGWWSLVDEISWAIRACARNLEDSETLIAVEWELLSNRLSPRTNWRYDFSNCLKDLDIEDKPYATVSYENLAPCVSASFTFGTTGGHVGLPIPAQLCLSSQAHQNSTPIVISAFELAFEGDLSGLKVSNALGKEPDARSTDERVHYFDIAAKNITTDEVDSKTPSITKLVEGYAELTLEAGQSKVFSFNLSPRDAGEIRATSVTLSIREEMFDLDVNIPLREHLDRVWWLRNGDKLSRKVLALENACFMEVRPKPPKLQISIPAAKDGFYTDEKLQLLVVVTNEEDDLADVRLHIHLSGAGGQLPRLMWASENTNTPESPAFIDALDQDLENHVLSRLSPSEKKEETLMFKALPEPREFTLEIRADYALVSDPQTPISKILREVLSFTEPFEVNYEYIPQMDSHPWPNYFSIVDVDDQSDRPTGLTQKFNLVTKILSLGKEPLAIDSLALGVVECKNDAVCTIDETEETSSSIQNIECNEMIERTFHLSVQKQRLEDHRLSTVSVRLDIAWRRASAATESAQPSTVTTLLIPSLSANYSEPRVLAASQPSMLSPRMTNLTFVIENPSPHVFTFNSTMEASEEFAFSGPKAMTTQLVPMSKKEIKYNLLPINQGLWIRPVLKVMDVRFGRVFRVIPTEGCKADKKGLMVWANAE